MAKRRDLKSLVEAVNLIAKEAGQAILSIYLDAKIKVDQKNDHSPLTQADLISDEIVTSKLNQLGLCIPILSEEINLPDFEIRSKWGDYWLIDPLDGTKEFINKNDEFTVNIALIQNNKATLGSVYCPARDALYYASLDNGAYKSDKFGIKKINTKTKNDLNDFVIVGSRSHDSDKIKNFINKVNKEINKESVYMPIGSSLKICMVAEGLANIYPRFGPTSEWDVAAAHAVLSEAGGALVDKTGIEIQYNKKRDILNSHFVAISSIADKWVLDFME